MLSRVEYEKSFITSGPGIIYALNIQIVIPEQTVYTQIRCHIEWNLILAKKEARNFKLDLIELRFYGPVNPLGSRRSLPNYTFPGQDQIRMLCFSLSLSLKCIN